MTELDDLVMKVERLMGKRTALLARHESLTAEVNMLATEAITLAVTKTALEHLLQRVQAENLTRIENLVSYGLRVVFPDRGLSLKATATSKRGVPWVDLTMESQGTEAPILSAFGGGPATVVAFLLRALALRRAGLAPLLVLDESFSHVSAKYVPTIGELLREMVDRAGVTILLVTHQPEFLSHATKAYRAVDGGETGTRFEAV